MAPAPSFSLSRALARMGLAAASLLAGCGWGRTVTLGAEKPTPYHFGAAAPLLELASTARTDNPTLTGDLLEIFFTSDRDSGNGDVWSARRASASVPFQAPAPVAEVNTPLFETSSAISSDGLTLWFGSDRAGGLGGLDVWVTTRPTRAGAWSSPIDVAELSSPGDDIPRPPGQHGLVMPFSSSRVVPGLYWTYLAARATPAAPFGEPVLVQEVTSQDRSTVDAFLTDDGLTLFYSSNAFVAPTDAGPSDAAPAVATSDLYVVFRRSTGDTFGDTQALSDLNTAGDERDPWLSPDGNTLYFTSDRGGVLQIYAAPVLPR